MTDKEIKELMQTAAEQAFAIGYLRGISALLWNLDGERAVQLAAEEAAYYDQQVDVLAHALMEE